MPPLVNQGEYYKRYGEYFDSINEYYSLRGDDPSLQLPEPVEVETDETKPSPEDLSYALFAKDAYKPINQRQDFYNYKYLPKDSTNRIGVYKSDTDNEIVYAIKGTDEEEGIQNFFRNTAIGFGGPITEYVDPTFRRYRKHIQEKNKKYSNYKPVVVGHSQGGTYAGLLGSENPNYKTITYNMGTGFVPTGGDIKCLFHSCDNIKNYRIAGDWASSNLLTRPFLLRPKRADKELVEQGEKAERFFLPSEVFIPHGINQFIDRKPDDLKDDYGTYGRKIAGRLAGIGVASGLGAIALAEATAVAPVAEALEAEVVPAVETALLPEGRLAEDIAKREAEKALEKEAIETVEDTEKMFKELVKNLPSIPETQEGKIEALKKLRLFEGKSKEELEELVRLLEEERLTKDILREPVIPDVPSIFPEQTTTEQNIRMTIEDIRPDNEVRRELLREQGFLPQIREVPKPPTGQKLVTTEEGLTEIDKARLRATRLREKLEKDIEELRTGRIGTKETGLSRAQERKLKISKLRQEIESQKQKSADLNIRAKENLSRFRNRASRHYGNITGEEMPISLFPEESTAEQNIRMTIEEPFRVTQEDLTPVESGLSKAERIRMNRNNIVNKINRDTEAKNRLLGEVNRGKKGETITDLAQRLKDQQSMPSIPPQPSTVSEFVSELGEKIGNNPIIKNIGTAGKVVGGLLGITATDVVGNVSYDRFFKPEEKELQPF